MLHHQNGPVCAKTCINFAHKDGVTALGWLSDAQLMSGGGDGCLCIWNREVDEAASA